MPHYQAVETNMSDKKTGRLVFEAESRRATLPQMLERLHELHAKGFTFDLFIAYNETTEQYIAVDLREDETGTGLKHEPTPIVSEDPPSDGPLSLPKPPEPPKSRKETDTEKQKTQRKGRTKAPNDRSAPKEKAPKPRANVVVAEETKAEKSATDKKPRAKRSRKSAEKSATVETTEPGMTTEQTLDYVSDLLARRAERRGRKVEPETTETASAEEASPTEATTEETDEVLSE